MADTVTIGGRDYRPLIQSTIEHDFAVMSQIRAAGLDQVTQGADESPESYVSRLLGQILDSGRVFAILGGLLIPAEVEDLGWTPAIGKATADALRLTTDPAEKQMIQGQIASLLIGFFRDGLTSLRSSARFSEASPTAGGTGARSDSASGPPLSGSAATTTPTVTPRLRPGLFARLFSRTSRG